MDTKTKSDLKLVVSLREAQAIQEFMRSQGWGTRVFKCGAMPAYPIEIDGWRVEPVAPEQMKYIFPQEGKNRVEKILQRGFKPEGWLIAHELHPHKSSAPVIADGIITTVTLGVSAIAYVSIMGLTALLSLPLFILDPLILCVASDETTGEQQWITVYQWEEL